MSDFDMTRALAELKAAAEAVSRAYTEMEHEPKSVAQVFLAARACKRKAEETLRQMLAVKARVSPEVIDAKSAAEKEALPNAVDRLFCEELENAIN